MWGKWRAVLSRTNRTYDVAPEILEQQTLTDSKDPSRKALLRQAAVQSEELSGSGKGGSQMGTEHLTETLLRNGPLKIEGEVCFMTQSPFRIMKAAANGKLAEVEKLYKEDSSRLDLQDNKGLTALHHAAKHGQEKVISFILAKKAEERLLKNHEDLIESKARRSFLSTLSKKRISKAVVASKLDLQTNDGDTALHLAAEYNHPAAVKMLLDAGADSSILNAAGCAPIHVAVINDSKDALLALVRHPSSNVNQPAKKGATPMHTAAYKDRDKCAVILLENGAKLCIPCDLGMRPVHVATLYGSAATLEAIMQYAEKAGYTREQVLNLRDSSRNMPLHTAVSGGDIRAVNMCLKAGAQICGVQDDKSTAIHLAAQQGSLEMIQAMFEAQPENKAECIHSRDCEGMTPLHRAAVFDRANVAQYLIEQGANKNDLDGDGMSPVLLGAAKKAWDTVEVLIKSSVDIHIRDKKNRNILHLIIRNGGKPEKFSFCLCNKTVMALTNEPDEYGCTPLHYASKQGQLKTVDSLLTMGASLNAKNNNRESPLHFAAGHGRINTCGRLLACTRGKNIINETNGDGQTPLHAAAMRGHDQVVLLLLQRGACVLKDRFGKTAIHLAAEEGYANTVKAILNVQGHLLNAATKTGDTCLHLAAERGHTAVVTLLMSQGAAFEHNFSNMHFVDVAIKNEQKEVLAAIVSHDRWDEAIRYCSSEYGCPMMGFIKQAPEICQMVLDRCRTPSKDDPNCHNFYYTYDFRFLDIDAATAEKFRKEKTYFPPLYGMNLMVEYNRVNCLSHPVCLAFLKMKWRAYGMWFWATNLIIYVAFLASLTAFITNYHYGREIHHNPNITNGSEPKDHWSSIKFSFTDLPVGQRITVVIILVFSILNMIKEIAQMFQQRLKYLMDMNNLLEWVLYITSTILVAPFLSGTSSPAQWQCGAIAVFLAWFNLLLFLQRFDLYGIYVVMFLEILRTLIQVLLVFSILIIAFGLSFYTLMYTDETNTFATPYMSLMTVIMMMLSNIEYIDSWVNPYSDDNPDTLYFASLSFLMLAVFILLMPILLMNLLIGLAVGDIESVQKDATLKRLAMTVELHTDLEGKLPAFLMKHVHKTTWIDYPNCKATYILGMVRKATGTGEDYSPKEEEKGQDSFIYQELYSQKKRMKSMQQHLDRQYDLLRLIVQKMEIRSEADDQEEADNFNGMDDQGQSSVVGVGWSNPTMRTTMLKQASVLAKWGKSRDTSKMD